MNLDTGSSDKKADLAAASASVPRFAWPRAHTAADSAVVREEMNDTPVGLALVSVVVPCFNEEASLPLLFQRLSAAAAQWSDVRWEVICIDDGSTDRTWSMLQAQQQADAHWKAVRFARNFGHQAAVSAGVRYATGDAVIVIDADLQDPPEELVRFIHKWREGFEVVYAVRRERKEGLLKRGCYWLFYRTMRVLGTIPIPLDSGDFCIMDRRVVDVINAMPERNRFVRGMRAWAGFTQVGLPYARQERAKGKPQYTFRKLVRLGLDGIFAFSTVPLKLASLFGLGVSILAFFGMIFTLCQRLFAPYFISIGLGPVPGFATIVVSILFLGGIQLVCMGILGEYLGRIYEEVKRRPAWVIREATPGLDLSRKE